MTKSLTTPMSPVAACSLRERAVMTTVVHGVPAVAGCTSRHNWISRPAAVPAVALTADFGPAYVDAKQAAPPRGVPR